MAKTPPGQQLFGEHPALYRPSIATALGSVNQAIMLERLHYWLQHSTNEYEGFRWVYNSYATWGEQVGMTSRQVQYALTHLQDRGLVIAINHPYNAWDKRLWWTLDEEAIIQFTETLAGDVTLVSHRRDTGVVSTRQPCRIDVTPLSDRSDNHVTSYTMTTDNDYDSENTNKINTDYPSPQAVAFDHRIYQSTIVCGKVIWARQDEWQNHTRQNYVRRGDLLYPLSP